MCLEAQLLNAAGWLSQHASSEGHFRSHPQQRLTAAQGQGALYGPCRDVDVVRMCSETMCVLAAWSSIDADMRNDTSGEKPREKPQDGPLSRLWLSAWRDHPPLLYWLIGD